MESWAQSFCVKKNGVNLYQGPKTSSAVSWTVGKNMPLQGTGEKKGSFVEVEDLDGQIHWIKRGDVSTKNRCLVIQVRSTRLRQGSGKNSPMAEMANMTKYSPFKDLGGEEGWTLIEDDTGAKAWVNLDHVWKPMGKRLRMSFENDAQ